MEGLERVIRRLVALGETLHAIVLHACGTHSRGRCASVRMEDQVSRAVEALHALGVSIVCAADGEMDAAALALWSAADYRVAAHCVPTVQPGSHKTPLCGRSNTQPVFPLLGPGLGAMEAQRIGMIGEVAAGTRALQLGQAASSLCTVCTGSIDYHRLICGCAVSTGSPPLPRVRPLDRATGR